MQSKSLYRIVLRPSDPLLTLVDWGDLSVIGDLPWAQQVQVDPLLGAGWSFVMARGNVARKWSITRVVQYGSAVSLHAACMSHDAGLPVGYTTDMDIRVLSQPDPGGTVTARTAARWTCARAAIESCNPVKNLPLLQVAYGYTIQLSNLTPAAP